MSELPSGWTHVSIDDLAVQEPRAITDGPFGSNLKTEHYQEAGPRVIRLQNIGEGYFRDEKAHISKEHFRSLQNHEAIAGDILVAMLGEKLPRACLVPPTLGPAIVKADCARVRTNPSLVYAPFISYALNSDPVRRAASELIHGIGRPRLGLNLLRTVKVPLAPLAEQRKVVDIIENYLSRVNEAIVLLERVQRNLKRYRASVLKAAVEGRLVPTEAELARAEKRTYEPASVLLKRILTERRQRWEKDGRRGKYKDPKLPEENLPELPEGWTWVVVDQLAVLVTDGDHNPPKRVAEGIPHLTAKHVKKYRISFEGCSFVSAEGFEQTRTRYEPLPGDIIVTCVGTVGETAIVPDGVKFSADRNLAGIRVIPRTISNKYIMYALSSPDIRKKIMQASGSTAQPHIYLSDLREQPVPLPPRVESERIVSTVDKQLSDIELLEMETAKQIVRTQRLRQSILKWAFEGKLVDQDPNDEPASALLARIKSTKRKP